MFSLAKLFDIFAANKNQGGKCICHPRISRLACKKVCFTGVFCHLATCFVNNNE